MATKSIGQRTFRLVINYDLSLQEMIRSCNLEKVDQDITLDHFPIRDQGKQEVEILPFSFKDFVSRKEAIREMRREGYFPCRIEHLLGLGRDYPKLQMRPIIALGSVWNRKVPCLTGKDDFRCLILDSSFGEWGKDHWFIGFRKLT